MPDKLVRYIEWQSGGRRTGRVAYVIGRQFLPEPIAAGAEWQIDSKFNVADEILRNPSIKDVLKAAITNGVKVVIWQWVRRSRAVARGLPKKSARPFANPR